MMKKEMKKVPAVRFKGFTGDWEQRKFSEFTKNVAVKNKSDLPLEVYAVTNDKGFIAQKEAHGEFGYMNNVDRTVYNIVPPNSFAYNPARINVGSIGYYSGTKNVIVSSLYEVFQTEDSIDDQFLWHWIKSDYFPKWVEKLQEGSVRLYFYYDKLQQVKMMLPSLEEQKKIGCCLEKLDKFLTLHQQKLDQLKKLKAYFLQNLFPAKGEKVPKIRFKGFTGEWEERKLEEIGKIITGNTPSTNHSEYYSKDGIPWITPTDIFTNTISESAKKLSKQGEKFGRVVPAGTILVTCIASIGKNTMLLKRGSFNQQINGLVPNQDKFDSYFLLTESEFWSKRMKTEAAAGTMQIVNKKDFSSIKTYTPSLTEQQSIGHFFSKIDSLITHHQRKLVQLQAVKKFLLQNLFV